MPVTTQARSRFSVPFMLAALAVLLSGCVGGLHRHVYETGYIQKGEASWYGPGFHGQRTASGELYDQDALTAAHRHLPFGAIVEVVRRDTGARVRVRITDRGPYVHGRIIDLSREAARRLDALGEGVVPVRIRVIRMPEQSARVDGYAVQVGVFRNPHGAHRLLGELAPHVPGLRLVPTTMEFGRAVRVVTRPYRNYETAARLAERIRSELGHDAFVVKSRRL